MDSKCKEGSKCLTGGDCESKAQTVFHDEQAEEKSTEGNVLLSHYNADFLGITDKQSPSLNVYLYWQVVAEHLSVEEVAGLQEAFDVMDITKRGKINLEELRIGLQKLGHPIADADLQILMDAVSIILLLAKLFLLFLSRDERNEVH